MFHHILYVSISDPCRWRKSNFPKQWKIIDQKLAVYLILEWVVSIHIFVVRRVMVRWAIVQDISGI
jgi:hypothetical protein